MQSLSTFSQLTVEELVHLHRHGCTAGLGLVPFQSNQFWAGYQDLVCVFKLRLEFEKQFNTQTGSKVVPLSDWTEVERLSAPLYILFICIEHSQHTSAKNSHNGPFYRCSPWGTVVLKNPAARGCICNEPFLLPWLLTVQMHLQILMNHIQIHTDTQTATPQREIVLSYPQML